MLGTLAPTPPFAVYTTRMLGAGLIAASESRGQIKWRACSQACARYMCRQRVREQVCAAHAVLHVCCAAQVFAALAVLPACLGVCSKPACIKA